MRHSSLIINISLTVQFLDPHENNIVLVSIVSLVTNDELLLVVKS